MINVAGLRARRLLLVSDAIAAYGILPGRYRLGSQEIVVVIDVLDWAAARSRAEAIVASLL